MPPFSPKFHQIIHNQAQPAANTDIFAESSFTQTRCSMFVLQIAMSNAGTLSVTITRGGNTQTIQLNGGVALVADVLYIFNILTLGGTAASRYTVNLRYSATGGTIRVLLLQEIETN